MTKQKTASAAVAARAASAIAPAVPSAISPYAVTCRRAWSVSHSEANPLSGGSPAIAIAPTRNAPPVHGMRRSRPPRRSSSSEPTALSNAPAPRKRSALKIAWFRVCSSAAASANAAHVSAPRARRTRQAPSPRTMIPMFSIECSASRRLRSCWKSAYVTPATAESAPSASTSTPNHTGRIPTQSTRTRTRA